MSLIVKECAKHYFFKNKSLKGFEDTVHYKPFKLLADKAGKDINEYLFSLLGYDGHEFLSAYQLYSVRVAFSEGNIEYVKSILNIDNEDKILESLTSTGLNPPYPVIGGRKFKYPDLVKLISEYLLTSKDLRVTGAEGISYGFLDYLNYVISSVEYLKVEKYIHQSDFKKIVDGLFPEIIVDSNVKEPIIEMRKLYISKKLSKKDFEQLKLDIIDNIIFNGSKVGLEDYLMLRQSYTNYLLMMSIKCKSDFNIIIELAGALDMSVEYLLETCNYNYIDILKQIEDMHCAIIGVEGGVKIYPYTLDENEDRYITCNVDDLAYLYSHDLLKSLQFLGDYAYVELPGNRVPVSTLFIGEKRNNFIRG